MQILDFDLLSEPTTSIQDFVSILKVRPQFNTLIQGQLSTGKMLHDQKLL